MSTEFTELTASMRRAVYRMPSYGQVKREIAAEPAHTEPSQPAPEHVACPWHRKDFLDALSGVNDPVFDLDPEGYMWVGE